MSEMIPHYEPKETGKRIQQLRKKKKLSQEQLAEKLNVSMNTIAKIECGLRTPSVDLLVDLAEFFGTSLHYLLLGTENTWTDHEAEKIEIDEVIKRIDETVALLLAKKEEFLQIRKELE